MKGFLVVVKDSRGMLKKNKFRSIEPPKQIKKPIVTIVDRKNGQPIIYPHDEPFVADNIITWAKKVHKREITSLNQQFDENAMFVPIPV
jgi:hypothetical protein